MSEGGRVGEEGPWELWYHITLTGKCKSDTFDCILSLLLSRTVRSSHIRSSHYLSLSIFPHLRVLLLRLLLDSSDSSPWRTYSTLRERERKRENEKERERERKRGQESIVEVSYK
jgi:hypothetical protein